jgi:hypothetical protein
VAKLVSICGRIIRAGGTAVVKGTETIHSIKNGQTSESILSAYRDVNQSRW